MSLTFVNEIVGNTRGEIQEFIEKETDRDTDVYSAAVSTTSGHYARVIGDWHVTDDDNQGEHLTVEVYVNNTHVHTAHIYKKGHVTAFS